MAIRYLDMFAGIGGFRSGLERLGGFTCVGYCEIDPYAKQAYDALYQTEGELYFDDARTIDPTALPDIDLICGGFPCQSFSLAGKRAGFEDARGTLFFEVARIAAVKRPAYLLLENVPGLLSHDGGRTFAAILTTLDELGYDVTWQVLNSKDFGVPQSRNRVYIVGYHREKRAGKILSFSEANGASLIQLVPGREGKRIYSADGVGMTLTSSAGGFAGMTGLYQLSLPVKVKTKSGYQLAHIGDSIDTGYSTLNSRRGRVGEKIAHTITTSDTQACFIDLSPGMTLTPLSRCMTARYEAGPGKRPRERSGVLTDAGPIDSSGREVFMVSVTAKDGKTYRGYVRKLTPLECWRLQGFSDAQFYKVQATGLSDRQLYKMAGNAVSVPVISALGEVIKENELAEVSAERNENA